VKPEVPQIVVVIRRLPSRNTGEESVHNDELLDFGGELRGIGIGHHEADVVPDNTGLCNADRLRERMNANGGCLHITAVLGNVGIADAGQVRRNDGEFVLQFVNQRAPHSRGLRVAVQKN
jgi:hypothetical protein